MRLRNKLVEREGGFTRHFPDGDETTIYEAAMAYADEGVPLVVLAGKEYGSGSSRDWAAKGTALLGVRAVLAESFERIHRSNLIGMGVLPLQFPEGETAQSLGLDGEETIEIGDVENGEAKTVVVTRDAARAADAGRIRGTGAPRHAERGPLLPERRHPAPRAARPALSCVKGQASGLTPALGMSHDERDPAGGRSLTNSSPASPASGGDRVGIPPWLPTRWRWRGPCGPPASRGPAPPTTAAVPADARPATGWLRFPSDRGVPRRP